MKGHTPLFILLSFLFLSRGAKAQVIAQDSLTLVAIYNQIPALHSDTTWLNGNVSTWNGVYVQDNKVYALYLNVLISGPIPNEVCGFDSLLILSVGGCDARGLIPKCIFEMPSIRNLSFSGNALTGVEAGADFTKLTSIEVINIYYNEMTEMPDFMSIPSPNFKTLFVGDNHFNFDDLMPLLSKPLDNYIYSPQQALTPWQSFTVHVGDTASFPDVATIAGASNNGYQWKYQISDSTYIPTSPTLKDINTSMMRVEGAQLSDQLSYLCEMTNPSLPGLVLKTSFIVMLVTDFLPQSILYASDNRSFCGETPLYLAAATTAFKTVSFVSLNDTIATVNSDNTLEMHKIGWVTIRATAPGDSIYRPATLDIDVLVLTRLFMPIFQISETLPTGEGGDLQLAVEEVTGMTYAWTTPGGQTYNTAAITVSPLTKADLGSYNVRVTQGTCVHANLFRSVNSLVYGKPVVYELITPNNDGDNETFYISNLDPSVYNEVSVFNASHQVVYHQENYRNDWDGGNLPVGTYYYFVKYGEQTYKGNLYIKR